MQLRKLEQKEHGSTRKLWEAVFQEDTKAFLDYYYFIKTKENEIYVVEEDGEIRSMLHLNPYMIQVGDKQFLSNYIIAVATEESYRGRGYMGSLLRESMQEMYRQKMPFTFLMPAAEAIYTPYDFRFVYRQAQAKLSGIREETEIEDSDAAIFDAEEMASFFNENFAWRYQVFACRDAAYYQTRVFEQQSENGGIRLIRKDGRMIGMFFYAKEEGYEILEPLFLPEYQEEFLQAVFRLTGSSEPVKVLACIPEFEKKAVSWEKKPMIMIRILHLETLLNAITVKEGENICCSFAVLDPILTKNSRIWRLENEESGTIRARETEDSQGVLTIGALTEFLFGYRSLEELKEEPEVFLTEELEKELQKIQPLNRIFLNEIV